MSNLSLIPAIVGISMSFAGFAGLFLALRPKDSEWQRDEIGQINAIVGYAFTAPFSGLFVVPLASLIGASSAIRVMSGFALVVAFYQHQIRVGTAWSRWSKVQLLSRRRMLMQGGPFMLVAIAEQVLLLANIVRPAQELYELALITMLCTPALTFVLVLSQVGSRRAT